MTLRRLALVAVLAALLAEPAIPSLHAQSAWTAALGGSAFGAYTRQSSLRGSDGAAAWGWVHGALGRTFASGSMTADAMVTLDPLVQGDCGYPRLMAGWALCSDAPLEDRSHANPFVMRLGARATRSIGPATVALDAALVGDPPLGVPSYMHRPSAAADPIVPMTMAETTPAHAVGAVLTLGLSAGPVGLEGSVFNGKGGATDRWDLAVGAPHSWAGRLTWRPASGLGLFVTAGEIEASDGHHAGMGAMRIRAVGAEWGGTVGDGALSAIVAGVERAHEGHHEWAGLLEALATRGRHTVFGRVEWADRSLMGMDVVILPDGTHEHNMTFLPYDVAELSAGYGLRVVELWRAELVAGGRYGYAHVGSLLIHGYGSRGAHTFSVYLNLRPRLGTVGHVHPLN